MHDSLSQVKLNEGIWASSGGAGGAAIGDQDGDARWRARHSIPRDQLLCCSIAPLDRIGLSSRASRCLRSPSLHPHQDLACDGRPPAILNSNLYVRDIQLQKQGNAPLGKW